MKSFSSKSSGSLTIPVSDFVIGPIFRSRGLSYPLIRDLRNLLPPVDLTTQLLDRAISSTIADFEDAVQFYSAVYSDADCIITRNAKDFPQDGIPVLSPTAFLNLK